MLRRDRHPKQPTFADQTRAAQSVPEDHVLMRMKRAADWSAVEAALAGYNGALNRQWEAAGLISDKRRGLGWGSLLGQVRDAGGRPCFSGQSAGVASGFEAGHVTLQSPPAVDISAASARGR